MTNVKKRSGNREPFDPNKIKRSIQKAGIDAGYTLDQMSALVDEVTDSIIEMAKNKSEIDTETIKENVLDKLEKAESAIVESWNKFDKKYKS